LACGVWWHDTLDWRTPEYFLDAPHLGSAERVRGERDDDCAWVRVLGSIYWWPAHEDREWRGAIISDPSLARFGRAGGRRLGASRDRARNR
jgi:hypothetical protein